MATSPYKVTFSKKNHEKNLLESEKTSNSASLSKVTSVAGLRMFVAFLVFATAPGMWMGMLAVSSYTPSIPIHLPGAFAKTNKATNILRPAIDAIFLSTTEDFLSTTLSLLKTKKNRKKNFFYHYHIKSSILKILSKSPRTQIRLLGTPRDFLRSRTTILGG